MNYCDIFAIQIHFTRRKSICQETDPEQLGRWLKCAARAADMEEFEKKI